MGSVKFFSSFGGNRSDVPCDITFYKYCNTGIFGNFGNKTNLTCYGLLRSFYPIFTPRSLVYQWPSIKGQGESNFGHIKSIFCSQLIQFRNTEAIHFFPLFGPILSPFWLWKFSTFNKNIIISLSLPFLAIASLLVLINLLTTFSCLVSCLILLHCYC